MDKLPAEIPVLTLPNTVFFPHTVIPLHIFEPRYRMMLRDVLRHHRIFALATLDQELLGKDSNREPPHHFATAGVIRACQKAPDGTSDLLLEGIWRISIDSIVTETPYRIVKATPIPDTTDASDGELRRLRKEILRAIRTRTQAGVAIPAHVERLISEIDDAAAVCDILLFSSVGDVDFKLQMLSEIDTLTRLSETIARIRTETEQANLQRRLQGGLDDGEIAHN